MSPEEREQIITDFVVDMESKKLTGIEYTMSSGWNFKLNHPKAMKLMGGKNQLYPRRKGFVESHLFSKAQQSNGSVSK